MPFAAATSAKSRAIRRAWYKPPSLVRKAFPTRDIHPIYASALRSTSGTISEDPATTPSSPSRLFKYVSKTVKALSSGITKGFKAVLMLSDQAGSSTEKKFNSVPSAAPVEPMSTDTVRTPILISTTVDPASNNGTGCSTPSSIILSGTTSIKSINDIEHVEIPKKSSFAVALTNPLPPSPTPSIISLLSQESVFSSDALNASPSVSETTAYYSPDVKEVGFDFKDLKAMLDSVALSPPALVTTTLSTDLWPEQTSPAGADMNSNKALLVPLPPSPTLTPSPSYPSAALEESIFDLDGFFAHPGPYGDSPEIVDNPGQEYNYADISTSLTFASSNFITSLLSDESFNSDILFEWESVNGMEALVNDRDSGTDGIMAPGSPPPTPFIIISHSTDSREGVLDMKVFSTSASFDSEFSPDAEKLNVPPTSSLASFGSDHRGLDRVASCNTSATSSHDITDVGLSEAAASNLSTAPHPPSPAACSPDEVFDIGASFGSPIQPKRSRKTSGRARQASGSVPTTLLRSEITTSSDPIGAVGTMGKPSFERTVRWGVHKEKKTGWVEDGRNDRGGRSQEAFVLYFAAIFEKPSK